MRRRSKDEGFPTRVGLALLTSVALHAVLAVPLHALVTRPVEPAPARRPVANEAVPILSEEEVDRLIAMAQSLPAPPRPKPEEKKPEKEEVEEKKPERPDGQVVEIPPPPREERPDDARLLSEYDSKVDKQTVSANNEAPQPRMQKSDRQLIGHGRSVDEQARARRRQPAPVEAKKPEPRERKARAEKSGDSPRKGKKQPTPESPREGEERPRVSERRGADVVEGEGPFAPGAREGGTRALQPSGGDEVGGVPNPPDSVADLLPTLGPQDMARKDGSIDHLEDVDKGAQTLLNTREYKHAWFFNRVKRSVQKRWRAVDAHRRYDPYGRVYGVRDRMTVVQVTIDKEGTLEDIFVTKDSGVAFLDEVALRAFREAQPFPNPPEELADPDGLIRFRFSFYLEINGRGFRMFRTQ